MTDKEEKLLHEIEQHISSRTQSWYKNDRKSYNQRRSEIEQELLLRGTFFDNMTMPVLEKLIERGMNLRWERISKFNFLTEDFIKKYINSLTPETILNNYPKLSEEVRNLFYAKLGVIKRLKYGVIDDEELIGNFPSYGNKLKKKIKKFAKNNPNRVSESLILFMKLIE